MSGRRAAVAGAALMIAIATAAAVPARAAPPVQASPAPAPVAPPKVPYAPPPTADDAAVDDEQEPELDPSLCNADITDRGDEHRMHFCTWRGDHRDSHEDSRSGMGWTDGQHYDRFDDEDDDDPDRG